MSPRLRAGDQSAAEQTAAEQTAVVSVPLRARVKAWWIGVDATSLVDADENAAAPADEFPFRARFKAWWNGVDLADLRVAVEKVPAPAVQSAPVENGEVLRAQWPIMRIRAAERVWGGGFVTPGNADYVCTLAKVFAMKPENSVLDLHAGLGGGARALVETYGVWVTGMEPSPELAAAAVEEATRAGLAKKAPVSTYDPETFELRKRSYDCVLHKELLYTVRDKLRFIEVVTNALKPHGQMMFTDYVLPTPDASNEAIQAWLAVEPVKPEPWDFARINAALSKNKFDVRTREDITEDHRRLIIDSWQGLMADLQPRSLPADLALALVQEAELWAARTAAMDSGLLKVFRFHVLKR